MYIESGADISDCGVYRYRLWRKWAMSPLAARWCHVKGPDGKNIADRNGVPYAFAESVVFIMLNPSTADGEHDDRTILKCIKFAKRLGYCRMEVVNLFGYRATKPEDIKRLTHDDDPVGPGNYQAVADRVHDQTCTLFICAWGFHGAHLGQDETMLGWLMPRKLHVLGFTQDGSPRHPLYLKDNSPLLPYNPPVRYG